MGKPKYYRYVITAFLVISWLYFAYVNRMIAIEPLQKYFKKEYTFVQTKDDIVLNYKEKLEEKYEYINLNGLYTKLSGGRKCNDIIKLKNGSLTSLEESCDTSGNAQKTVELKERLEKEGIDFLYVLSPFKTNVDLLPYGLPDSIDENCDIFLKHIDGKVPYIDLRPYFTDNAEHIDQYFYKTDHHWNPLGAFKAFQIISDYLQMEYPNESINGYYQNLDNWEINRKEKWFLGSRGKRTGTYFGGVDDLIWLTPKFDTKMSLLNIYKNEFYYGDYYDANIREEYILEKDYFMKNAFCVYIGGDYPLVQHRNTLAPVDKKILIIKDSFVLPLQTYFSTVFNEVDVIDLRHYTAGTLYEYIEESKPDIVIMNLNGGGISDDVYFNSGITEYTNDVTNNQIYQNDSVEIVAGDDSAYRYSSIYSGIEAGKRYTLLCDSVSVVQGDVDGISLKLFDKTTQTVYDCSMWDIKYCEKTNLYEWTFTAPADVNNLEVLIYSGIAGHTNGKAVTINNVRLLQQ